MFFDFPPSAGRRCTVREEGWVPSSRAWVSTHRIPNYVRGDGSKHASPLSLSFLLCKGRLP